MLVTGGQRHESTQLEPLLHVVERAIARRKQHRAVATRYDKLAASYHSWLVPAALLLWLPA